MLIARMRDVLFRSIALRHLQRTSRKLETSYPRMAIFSFDYIGHQINLFGRFEKPELTLLAQILKQNGIGATALDIGANIGNHTLFFSDLFSAVHAFEPNPLILPLLGFNVGHRANVSIHPFGASSRSGLVEAVIPSANMGGGHVATGPRTGEQVLEFALRPLDEVDELLEIDMIDFVKLDVEGHEFDAISGFETLLRRHRPVIAFEQNATEIEAGSTAALEKLRSLGYGHFYEIRSGRFRTPQWLPRMIRNPLKLIEAAFDDPYAKAMIEPIKNLEQRSYPMVLASYRALVH